MLLIYVLCDTLQFYCVYYAFAKLYFVLCVETSGPQYEGTCPWTLGQVAMEGFLVSGASAALQSSAACSVGQQ